MQYNLQYSAIQYSTMYNTIQCTIHYNTPADCFALEPGVEDVAAAGVDGAGGNHPVWKARDVVQAAIATSVEEQVSHHVGLLREARAATAERPPNIGPKLVSLVSHDGAAFFVWWDDSVRAADVETHLGWRIRLDRRNRIIYTIPCKKTRETFRDLVIIVPELFRLLVLQLLVWLQSCSLFREHPRLMQPQMTTLRQCLRMQRETAAKRHKRLINALPDALSEPSAATAKVWLEQCIVAERQATCRDHNAVMIELSRFIYGAPLDFDDTDDVEQDGPPPALACSRPLVPERCTRDNCEYVQHSSRGHAGFCCGTCRDPERHGRAQSAVTVTTVSR